MKNKNKDQKPRLPASTRINRNNFLLLVAKKDIQHDVKRWRSQFKIPTDGFTTNAKISAWTTWLAEDCENRLNVWRNLITTILVENDLHDGLRDAVETYIMINRVVAKDILDEQIGSNCRVFREFSKTNRLVRKSIFVEFLGPVSKEEMLNLRNYINKIMGVITKSQWEKVLASKQNFKTTFDDYQCFNEFQKGTDAAYCKRGYRDLVNENEKMTEKEILRKAGTKKKSIQRFKKQLKVKK